MGSPLNLLGLEFGRLTVTSSLGKRGRQHWWYCQCQCGNTKEVSTQGLRSKHTQSCGCMHAEANALRRVTHGLTESPEYATWCRIKDRCENRSNPKYPRYGGRGIKVCERWSNSFESFLADMGARPTTKHSIDRIDNDGDYEPGNCRWATPAEQARNKSNNRWITCGGIKDTLTGWSKRLDLPVSSLHKKLADGVDMSRVVAERRVDA